MPRGEECPYASRRLLRKTFGGPPERRDPKEKDEWNLFRER